MIFFTRRDPKFGVVLLPLNYLSTPKGWNEMRAISISLGIWQNAMAQSSNTCWCQKFRVREWETTEAATCWTLKQSLTMTRQQHYELLFMEHEMDLDILLEQITLVQAINNFYYPSCTPQQHIASHHWWILLISFNDNSPAAIVILNKQTVLPIIHFVEQAFLRPPQAPNELNLMKCCSLHRLVMRLWSGSLSFTHDLSMNSFWVPK